jgi:hypothetical protein
MSTKESNIAKTMCAVIFIGAKLLDTTLLPTQPINKTSSNEKIELIQIDHFQQFWKYRMMKVIEIE